MSTRSIIVITGKGSYGPETIRLYKHSDGYPTGNLPLIRTALKQAEKISLDDQARFKDRKATPVPPEGVAGLVIGASVSIYGVGARIDEDYDEKDNTKPANYGKAFIPAHLGQQCDLEWIYLVDLEAKSVSIYGGGFTGKEPQATLKQGEVDPLTYALKLSEEYQESAGLRIQELVAEIETMGFSVNPSLKKKEEPKPPKDKQKPTRATEVKEAKKAPKLELKKETKKVKSSLKSKPGLTDKDIRALAEQLIKEAMARSLNKKTETKGA